VGLIACRRTSISALLFLRESVLLPKSCRASEAHFLNFFAFDMWAWGGQEGESEPLEEQEKHECGTHRYPL
jgi:hypothetical protein